MRILFNVNAAWFLISHRLEIARAARDAGFEVHVAAGVESSAEKKRLEGEGFRLHRMRISRGGMNPVRDLRYLLQLRGVITRIRPDIVHNVTVKPVVYGTIAARWMRVPGIVNAVSGLGYAFTGEGSRKVVALFVRAAYKLALSTPDVKVIFQNKDDLRVFEEAGIVEAAQTVLIRGSGVDLEVFGFANEPEGSLVVVLPARMLRDKGIVEFVEAARLLRDQGCSATFVLAGKLDAANPASLRQEELRQFERENGVQWVGHVNDMAALYRRSHIVCLPSYREGLPKALLEACAVGRAIVATDVPGCREAVRHGENGLLVEARSSRALAAALKELLENGDLRRKMGAAGRRIAESEFDVHSVVRATLGVYESVVSKSVGRSA